MKNILNNLSFTKNEAKAIIFIVSVLITGMSIKYYKHIVSSSSDVKFDFTLSDKEFIERSRTSGNSSYPTRNDSGGGSASESLISENLKQLTVFTGEKVNINTAGRNELIELPGVGEATADRIIAYRDQNDGFKKIENLMNVKGIGKKKFEKLKQFVKTN